MNCLPPVLLPQRGAVVGVLAVLVLVGRGSSWPQRSRTISISAGLFAHFGDIRHQTSLQVLPS